MRLLISGTRRNTNTTGAFIISNFNGSVDYEILRFTDAFADLMSNRFFRLLYRFVPTLVIRQMDRIFLKQVQDFNPDVILIFKGMEISKWSLKKIRKMGVKLVNFNFDHPFLFFSRGTGNKFVKEAIPYYDLHISYSSFIASEVHKKFNVRTVCIPFGFHLTEQQYAKVKSRNNPEINKLCFVGNPDDHRVEWIKRLIADGCPVDLYGFGWEKRFASHPLLTIHPPRKPNAFWADPVEFWEILRQYRVQLNFFRPHNEGSHNLRTFEVPAVGGVLVTPESAEQQIFFEPGEEIFFYKDYPSLLAQCKNLLAQDQASIRKIRDRAREKSLRMDYSYRRRTEDLLKILHSLTQS